MASTAPETAPQTRTQTGPLVQILDSDESLGSFREKTSDYTICPHFWHSLPASRLLQIVPQHHIAISNLATALKIFLRGFPKYLFGQGTRFAGTSKMQVCAPLHQIEFHWPLLAVHLIA